MFDSLEETMKHDEAKETTLTERVTKYAVIGVIALAVIGGLLMGIRMLA